MLELEMLGKLQLEGVNLLNAEVLHVQPRIIRQKLQRGVPTEAHVFRFVDFTHPAGPELAQQAVVTDHLGLAWCYPFNRQASPGSRAGL